MKPNLSRKIQARALLNAINTQRIPFSEAHYAPPSEGEKGWREARTDFEKLYHSTMAVVAQDKRGKINFYNSSAAYTFWFPEEAAMGRRYGGLLVPERLRQERREVVQQVLKTGHAKRIQAYRSVQVDISAMREFITKRETELADALKGTLSKEDKEKLEGKVRDAKSGLRAGFAKIKQGVLFDELTFRYITPQGHHGIATVVNKAPEVFTYTTPVSDPSKSPGLYPQKE